MSHRPHLSQLGLIVTALLAFGLAYQEWPLSVGCAIGVLSAYANRFEFGWPSLNRIKSTGIVILVLLLVSVGYYFVSFSDITPAASLIRGFFFELVAVWVWYLPPRRQWRDAGVVACSTFLALAAGMSLNNANRQLVFLMLCLFGIQVLGELIRGHLTQYQRTFATKREKFRYWGVICLISVVIVGMTVVGSTTLNLVSRNLFRIVGWLESASGTGLDSFSDQMGASGSLILSRQSSLVLEPTIVATVDGLNPPGYLRTQVFSVYTERGWETERSQAQPLPSDWVSTTDTAQQVLFPAPTHPTLGNTPHPASSGLTRQVQLFADFHGVLPLSYGTTGFTVDKSIGLKQSRGPSIWCLQSAKLTQYQFSAPFPVQTDQLSPQTLSDSELALQKAIPPELVTQLQPIAHDVIGGPPISSLEAARRVETFFRTQFVYSLDVKLNPKGDPIVDFIQNRRPAYCKYYASGMVLLLRSIGIPARVAAGFYTQELNGASVRWIVRQQHAHAWCEVYDQESLRWVPFDPTPPTVLNYDREQGFARWWKAAITWLSLIGKKLIVEIAHLNLANLMQKSWNNMKNAGLTAWGIGLTFALTGFLLYKIRFRLSLGSLNATRFAKFFLWRRTKPEVSTTEDLLADVFRAFQVAGFTVRDSETVAEFIERVEQTIKTEDEPGNPDSKPHSVPDLQDALRQIRTFFEAYQDIRYSPSHQTTRLTTDHHHQLRGLAHQAVETVRRMSLDQPPARTAGHRPTTPS
ncbi:MAG: transglutaminase domain-containing protein [Acidobacteria bacterium]|nr:transglutaminase domain-containing protein [Acidobacteriota bacterium]